MQITFLLTHIPNPRINKRIMVAKRCGEVAVFCIRRTAQNLWEPCFDDVMYEIIQTDLPTAKHLLMRLAKSIKEFQRPAMKFLDCHMPQVIVLEGLDALSVAKKYKKRHSLSRIIYEVADLRECFIEKPSSVFSRLLTFIIRLREHHLFTCVDYLIVTSEKFYEYHYKTLLPQDRVIFLPNAPDPIPFAGYRKKDKGRFTVGFIGGLRYIKQMKMLVDIAEQVNCDVLFAGGAFSPNEYEEIMTYCSNKDFAKFFGKYDYNDEIANLYGMVDCVYSVYDADNANVKIALPNKLYEAILCELPIIVAKGTYLSEMVEKWGVGVSVSATNPQELEMAIKKLSTDSNYYTALENNCRLHKPDISLERYSDKLAHCIQGITQ